MADEKLEESKKNAEELAMSIALLSKKEQALALSLDYRQKILGLGLTGDEDVRLAALTVDELLKRMGSVKEERRTLNEMMQKILKSQGLLEK